MTDAGRTIITEGRVKEYWHESYWIELAKGIIMALHGHGEKKGPKKGKGKGKGTKKSK